MDNQARVKLCHRTATLLENANFDAAVCPVESFFNCKLIPINSRLQAGKRFAAPPSKAVKKCCPAMVRTWLPNFDWPPDSATLCAASGTHNVPLDAPTWHGMRWSGIVNERPVAALKHAGNKAKNIFEERHDVRCVGANPHANCYYLTNTVEPGWQVPESISHDIGMECHKRCHNGARVRNEPRDATC